MKIFRYLPVFIVGSALVACGGSKPAPAVNPSTPSADTLKVNVAPSVPELTPIPEPSETHEQKVFLDNAVDRYSYALGVDFGRALSNINVPVKLDVLMDAMRDVLDSSREILMTDSQSEAALQDLLNQMQMQKDIDEGKNIETEAPKNKKESGFVHNDIRDKIKEIGECLGFKATTEVTVANGARVDTVWEVSIGNMGRIIYVFEVQTSGSIDSLILNLMKAKNNKAVQGIVAVSDAEQLVKIKKEVEALPNVSTEIKYWDYTEVLEVHEALQKANESINKLGLVPVSL